MDMIFIQIAKEQLDKSIQLHNPAGDGPKASFGTRQSHIHSKASV